MCNINFFGASLGDRTRIDNKDGSSVLTITETRSEDSGRYEVILSNEAGVANAVASVTVEGVYNSVESIDSHIDCTDIM